MNISQLNFPLLLDGGLSNRLEELGCNLNNKLWTANVLQDNPELIVQTHLDYLEAGARIITTASYQATLQGFMDSGIEREKAIELIHLSIQLAKKAIDSYLEKNPRLMRPLIAASIGPYGAYLADGSEYRGNYGLNKEELIQFHQQKVKILDGEDVDFLAFETIPSLTETKAIAALVKTARTPVWVTFSCKDGEHISDGTRIRECIEIINDSPNIVAVGVNCTKPRYITSLLNEIKEAMIDQLLIVYPNSGESFNAELKTWQEEPDDSFSISEWLGLGVHIIGGCCRIGPDQIREINKVLHLLKRN